MKIALIGDANMLHMPYIYNYEKILRDTNVNYDIINWDRFHIEENNCLTFKDTKIGHQRNLYDYYKYKNFIIKQLKKTKYDKLIIFGLPISSILKNYIKKYYLNNYIIDIRDFHKIIKIFNPKEIIKYSHKIVISSPGFISWLPESDKYIINHNSSINNIDNFNLNDIEDILDLNKIKISTIGAIRHWDVNINLVNKLKNNSYYELIFHGEGTINEKLIKYVNNNRINNVFIYGRYEKSDEGNLYKSTNLINMLLNNNNINSKTCLTNRLYNSALYGKPMITIEKTYLADIINKYKLGLVLENYNNLDEKIKHYIKKFDKSEYNKGRKKFWKLILNDNIKFENIINDFVKEYK